MVHLRKASRSRLSSCSRLRVTRPARTSTQSKLELEWRETWVGGHYAKATAKPVVDWVGGGRTGAVLELEGGWVRGPRWTLASMAGHLLWGEGVPSTYETRAGLKVVYHY